MMRCALCRTDVKNIEKVAVGAVDAMLCVSCADAWEAGGFGEGIVQFKRSVHLGDVVCCALERLTGYRWEWQALKMLDGFAVSKTDYMEE
jgi:hypothetical protein